MGYLGDAEQCAVDSGVLDALSVVLLVELVERPEFGDSGTLELGESVNLLSQCMRRTLEEGLGQDAGVAQTTELREKRMGIQ